MEDHQSTDRRTLRSRKALVEALAEEVLENGLDGLTVAALTDRADLTRRTFYTHYRDVAHLVESSEAELLDELARTQAAVRGTTLDDLYEALRRGEPYPGAIELLEFVKANALYMQALLGPQGDPSFQLKMKQAIRDGFTGRLLDGIDLRVVGPLFDYYVEYVISAQLGIVQRWLETGLVQSPREMARIVTHIMFLRPGDLYGRPIEQNAPDFLDLADLIPSYTTEEE